MRPVSEQVVVITGASSGIGRETAKLFGEHGSGVVLAARSHEALRSAAHDVEDAGGRAHIESCDVSNWEDVERLADNATSVFGRIDTWVNCAAITEYATVEQTTPEEMQRIVSVNLLGVMYGSKVAMDRMIAGDGGVIINVSSVLGKRAVPLQAVYSATKHGIKGFTEALRLELGHDHRNVHAVTVFPASINTPFFEHARSKMGAAPKPLPPVYQPHCVAEAIVHAAEHPQDEIFVGGAGKLFEIAERINPSMADIAFGNREFSVREQLTAEPENRIDNLFEPMPGEGSAEGRFSEKAHDSSVYTRELELHPERKAAIGMAALAGSVMLARRLATRRG